MTGIIILETYSGLHK